MSDVIEKEYRICSVTDSELVDGFVEIFLEPVDKTVFETPPENTKATPNIIVRSNSDVGNIPIPIQQMIEQIPSHVKQMQNVINKNDDPRDVLLIENKVDFDAHGWKYNDKIIVSFRKKEEK